MSFIVKHSTMVWASEASVTLYLTWCDTSNALSFLINAFGTELAMSFFYSLIFHFKRSTDSSTCAGCLVSKWH
jgi:hypothetical protein